MKQRQSGNSQPSPQASYRMVAAGVFLAVLGIYILANPGRIDIIDGQLRYEVGVNWMRMGRPIVWDPPMAIWGGVRGRGGFAYSYYGPLGSLAAIPLMWVGNFFDDPPGEATRFLFSLTTSVFGALTICTLFLFYIKLGVATKKALVWSGVTAFSTLLWSASETTNDNVQHACFVLAAVYFGFISSERRSPYFAALGGLMAGLLLTYQSYFGAIIPLLAVSTLGSSCQAHESPSVVSELLLPTLRLLLRLDFRGAIQQLRNPAGFSPEAIESFHHAYRRYGIFVLTSLVGIGLALAYNDLRFGSLFESGVRGPTGNFVQPFFGNPLAGLLTLTVSPGKSFILYCPPVILGFAGIRRIWQHRPQLGLAILAASMVLVLFLSTIAFGGGAWCWGPRYLVPLVPLWALAFPFAPLEKQRWRNLALVVIAAGVIVQCLGISVEDQRYFFERGLTDFYWAHHPWFEFEHSQILARPAETFSLIKGPPREAKWFNTNQEPPTYTSLRPGGIPQPALAPRWIRRYRVFYVPKPWPLWMWGIPPNQRALNLPAWLAGTLGVTLLGFALMHRGMRHEP